MARDNSFTVLFDYDSMIYKAVYKIATISDIRQWFRDGRSREWMEKEIVHLSVNRLSNMGDGILIDIEDTGVDIFGIEYFLTDCKRSMRKEKVKTYKANRKPNKWVNMVRKYVLEMGFAQVDDEWEADDLIKDRAVELGVDKYVICTVDKDLKQIPGIHFDYYRPRLTDSDGKPMFDQWGNRMLAPCRGLSIVTEEEADRFFWTQMLTGDSTDNIKGIPGIGPKKAEKLLDGCTSSGDCESIVLHAYTANFGEKEGLKQFNLHKLMIGLGVNHRP